MVLTPSTMLSLGTEAPDFELPQTDGYMVYRDDFKGKKGLLVIFMCNHCPYVIHVREEIAKLAKEYQAKDIGVVAINANNVDTHPADSPEKMAEESQNAGYTFPYLYDETQEVAKAYNAACTPDFFLFDGELKLFYRGQLDDSRPKSDVPVTGKDLRGALDALLAGQSAAEKQIPSMGCNIKWKPGNEPAYFSA